ncbi:MAG: flavin reductase family protein [Phycisphaerales bacterium]
MHRSSTTPEGVPGGGPPPRTGRVPRRGLDGQTLTTDPEIIRAMASIPGSRFIMTAAFEDVRRGFCVSWVQQASVEPPTISVSIRKGHDGAPIIRDSHAFGLCQLPRDDRFLWKKFCREDNLCDPFHSLDMACGRLSGVPLIRRSRLAFECEVAMHADWESDHELYIGRVVAVHRFQEDSKPDVLLDDSVLGESS